MKYAIRNSNDFIVEILSEIPNETPYYAFLDEIEVNIGDIFEHPNFLSPNVEQSKDHIIKLAYNVYANKIMGFMGRLVIAEEAASWSSKIDEMQEYGQSSILPSGGILESFDSYVPWPNAANVTISEYIDSFQSKMAVVKPLMGKLDKCLQTHIKTIEALNTKQDVMDYDLSIGWPI